MRSLPKCAKRVLAKAKDGVMPTDVVRYPTGYQRKHGPRGYQSYSDYKPWLRDEFVFRCVYCLEREQWYPNRADAFSVDHIVPQSKSTTRICDYSNLVYACLRCNSA